MQDLTGIWDCEDGGTYYLTQRQNNLYLYGSGEGWYNVGFGIINPDSQTVVISWADIPNSSRPDHHGTAFLDASQEGKVIKKEGDAAFGIGNFTKQA